MGGRLQPVTLEFFARREKRQTVLLEDASILTVPGHGIRSGRTEALCGRPGWCTGKGYDPGELNDGRLDAARSAQGRHGGTDGIAGGIADRCVSAGHAAAETRRHR